MSRVEVAVKLDAALGESPVWDVETGTLHCLDILAHRIHRLDPASGALTTLDVDGVPGSLSLRADGGYIAGVGLDVVTIAADGAAVLVVHLPAGDRTNDGKCDARGRLIIGTMDAQERTGAAALYQVEPDGTVAVLLDDVALSNGMDWSPTGDRFYYIDTPTRRVSVFDYDLESGAIADRRTFADLAGAAGRPDGLVVDAEGGVWVAVARAGVVHRYAPDGRLDAVLEFPTPVVTCPVFGGATLGDLYVTSSRALLAEPRRSEDPLAGAVFVVEGVGATGRPPHRFGAPAVAAPNAPAA